MQFTREAVAFAADGELLQRGGVMREVGVRRAERFLLFAQACDQQADENAKRNETDGADDGNEDEDENADDDVQKEAKINRK